MTKWRKMVTKQNPSEIVTWRELNERLRQIENETEAEQVYLGLKNSKKATLRMLHRAYSRWSYLRRRREHREMRKAEA